jgi:hypothetical protein
MHFHKFKDRRSLVSYKKKDYRMKEVEDAIIAQMPEKELSDSKGVPFKTKS